MTRQDKIKHIRDLLTGRTALTGDSVPLFWKIDQEGYYVAGEHRLTEAEFEELTEKTPCFPSAIVYVVPPECQ